MISVVFWVALLVLVLAYMSLWYLVGRYVRRYDVVDSAWGPGFVLVAWASLALHANFSRLTVVSAILVSIWGLRLGAHISARNWRKPTEDYRYQQLRQQWGAAEHRKAYTNIFLLQGLLVLLVSLPMIALAFTYRAPNVATYVGWALWLGGIAFETLADRQLAVFLLHRPKGTHSLMTTGLWRYSRHPNYFGELAAWWGAAVVACSVGAWWGIIGALAITWLITKVSGIPPLEKHYEGNAAYAAYRRRTSVLIPLPPKADR